MVTRAAVAERYLTPRDAAERLLISERAVRHAIERGELPAVKVCRRVRIAQEDFEAWVARAAIVPAVRPELPTRTSAPGSGLHAVLRGLDP